MLVLLLFFMAVPESQCGLCHPDVRGPYENSVHSAERVTCIDCHGGDPRGVSLETAHGKDFRGRIRRPEIPGRCASCHSDVSRMRPYNLPSDQYALYQTSQHGKLLAEGDARVAVCTDCHGTHEILPHLDPRSRVFWANLPQTCGECHGNADLMSGYGKEARVLSDYLSSIHGRELLENRNASAPSCINCHGAHGATPPGIGDVTKVCGTCHPAERSALQSGPHGALASGSGIPECTACHGNHRVQRARIEEIQGTCLDCHEEGSAAAGLLERVTVLVDRAREEVEDAQVMVELAREVPLYVEGYEARLEQARTQLLESGPVVHALSLEAVEPFAREARSLGEEIQADLHGELSERRLRRLGLIIFWFYVLLSVWILLRIRRKTAQGVE